MSWKIGIGVVLGISAGLIHNYIQPQFNGVKCETREVARKLSVYQRYTNNFNMAQVADLNKDGIVSELELYTLEKSAEEMFKRNYNKENKEIRI